MKPYDYLFNSQNHTSFKNIQLANGYISKTTLFFELENIFVEIEAKGHIIFKDNNDSIILSTDVESPDSGKGVYTEVFCKVENKTIFLRFPQYVWIDNYPHCDGEHDRWDTKIIGYNELRYNLDTKDFSVEPVDK